MEIPVGPITLNTPLGRRQFVLDTLSGTEERLLDDEGIYSYFRHEASRHVLVLADSESWCRTVDCAISFSHGYREV